MFQRIFGRAEEARGAGPTLGRRLTRSPVPNWTLTQPAGGDGWTAPCSVVFWFRAELEKPDHTELPAI